jgi:hypothetical protein
VQYSTRNYALPQLNEDNGRLRKRPEFWPGDMKEQQKEEKNLHLALSFLPLL